MPWEVRRVESPLVLGRPLLVAPDLVLVRWPDREPPEPGIYTGPRTLGVVAADLETVLTAFRGSPVDRCEAVERLPEAARLALFSYPQASNMVRVALDLEPPLRAHLRRHGASLRALFWVCGVRGLEAQSKRWNAWVEGTTAAVPARRKRRESPSP